MTDCNKIQANNIACNKISLTSQSPRNDLATKLQAVEKPKKERITCKRYCPVWNDIDHDCEIYGEHHFTPRTCPHYNKELKQND